MPNTPKDLSAAMDEVRLLLQTAVEGDLKIGDDRGVLNHDPHHSSFIPDTFPQEGQKVVKANNKIIAYKHYDVTSLEGGMVHNEFNLGRKIPVVEPLSPPPPPPVPPVGIYEGETKILYGNDKSDIETNGAKTLREVAQYLKNNPKATITLHSSTDRRASPEYNQQLSEKRTNAAYASLIKYMSELSIQNPEQQAQFDIQSTGEEGISDPDGQSNPQYRATNITVKPPAEAVIEYEKLQQNYQKAMQEWDIKRQQHEKIAAEVAKKRAKIKEVEHNYLIDNNSPNSLIISPAISEISEEKIKEHELIEGGYGSVLLSADLERPTTIHLQRVDLEGDPKLLAGNIRFLVKADNPNTKVTFIAGEEPNSLNATIEKDGKTKVLGVIHYPDGVEPKDLELGVRDRSGNVRSVTLNQTVLVAAINQNVQQNPYGQILEGRVDIAELRQQTPILEAELMDEFARIEQVSSSVPQQPKSPNESLNV